MHRCVSVCVAEMYTMYTCVQLCACERDVCDVCVMLVCVCDVGGYCDLHVGV